jgi:hypothetical protein
VARRWEHLSDQQLLLDLDRELSPRYAVSVHLHLEACECCRARRSQLESALAAFERMHHESFDLVPFYHDIRRIRLSTAVRRATERNSLAWFHMLRFGAIAKSVAYSGLALVITGAALRVIDPYSITLISKARLRTQTPFTLTFEASSLPNKTLTPGAARRSAEDACIAQHEEVIKPVSAELRNKVFEEYGMTNINPDDYETDYLIAPDLGGQEDIRNLWPQPRKSAGWNSEAKDALEERLHGLVCSGQLNILTAQKDISSNWTEAYQRYFKTNRLPSLHPAAFSSLGRNAVLALSIRVASVSRQSQ